MQSLLTINSLKIKKVIASLEETRLSLLSIKELAPNSQETTHSSPAASEIEDEQHEIDFIDTVSHCIRILLRTQRMTQDRLDALIRQHKRLKKDIAKLVLFFIFILNQKKIIDGFNNKKNHPQRKDAEMKTRLETLENQVLCLTNSTDRLEQCS
jgi:hypothetical protein